MNNLYRYRSLGWLIALAQIPWWYFLTYQDGSITGDFLIWRVSLSLLSLSFIWLTYTKITKEKLELAFGVLLFTTTVYQFIISALNYNYYPYIIGSLLTFILGGVALNSLRHLIIHIVYSMITVVTIMSFNYVSLEDPKTLLIINITAILGLIASSWDRIRMIENIIESKTKIEQQYLELAQHKEKAIHQAKLAELGDMSAKVSHEINNPLAIIMGNVDMSHRRGSFSEKHYNNIKKAIDRISKIITSLKKSNRRVQEGEEKQVIGIRDLVTESVEYYSQLMKNEDIDFIVNNEISNEKVSCHESEIMQVIINLINNSRYHLLNSKQDSNRIEVDVTKVYDRIIISVQNSGHIPTNIVEKLFTPFFTTKPSGKGTGLGLSLSSDIIAAHDGELKLSQNEKNIVQFSFSLQVV